MGDRRPARGKWLPVLMAVGFALFQAAGRSQDRAAASRTITPGPASSGAGDAAGEAALRRLAGELKHFRAAGDADNTARIFRQMFPAGTDDRAASALEAAGLLPSNRIEGFLGNGKTVAAGKGTVPVFSSADDEKDPAAAWFSDGGKPLLFSAAELWAGGRSASIRVGRSSDSGATWPETLVIGDGRAWTRPSLRQVAAESVGLAFVRDGGGADGDIVFARLAADLTAEAEFPVSIGPGDARHPTLAADFPAFSLPFVYIVYAEAEGTSRSVKVKVSPDLGASWSPAVSIDSFSAPSGMAVEAAAAYDLGRNVLHVAYTRPQGPAAGVAVSSSRTFGASWSAPVAIAPADDRSNVSPRIAARDGAVFVVFEHRTSGGGADVLVASSSDSGRRWTRPEGLASSAGSETCPDVAAGAGPGSPGFFASFIEDGTRVRILSRDGPGRGGWLTEGVMEAPGASVGSGPAVVVPSAAASGRGGAGVVWAIRNPDSDVIFGGPVLLDAGLNVTPSNQNVPAAAGTAEFAVEKTGGGGQVDWTAAIVSGSDWLSIQSGASGTGSGTIVAAFLDNPDPASRVGSIRVTPADETIPAVTVTVTQAGVAWLDVEPAAGLVSSGAEGGPFSPAGQDYTLTNSGGTALSWTAAASETWISAAPASGVLAPGAGVTVAVAIGGGADSLAPGVYGGEIAFSNTTNGAGTTSRSVGLTVTPRPGALTVSPAEGLSSTGPAGGPFGPSAKDYLLTNEGGEAIDWTASKTQTWTSLSALSGTLEPGASVTVAVSIAPAADSLPAGSYDDTVTFANATNALGTTERPVALTVAAPGALEVTPVEGLAASGYAGGPFAPSSRTYALRNAGGWPIGWTASKIQAWTSLSSASGALDPGATSDVVVSINAAADALPIGSYSDTVTITNITTGTGTTSRPVALTVEPRPGALEVTPAGGLSSSGYVGGPFSPSSLAYTLRNAGETTIMWTASRSEAWTSLSAASGTLAAGATASVVVSINAAAEGLAAGAYDDTVVFANATNGGGSTTRPVSLTVSLRPGALAVTPVTGLTATGPSGGPFTPSSVVYTLRNTGEASISWTAAKAQAWVGLSSASGTLAGGAATTVTVSIAAAADALPPGGYGDTVQFVNVTNGGGSTARPVTLTIGEAPFLSVAPAGRDVAYTAGTTTFDVANTGGGTLVWTATVVAGGDWLSIQAGASGSGPGTIVAAFTDNRTSTPRISLIRVTAAGAGGSPKDVTVSQAAGTFAVGLAAERLVEKAWIIQREFGRLTVTVANPASIPIAGFIIYRRAGAGSEQVLQQIAGSAVTGSTWTFDDAFLEPGTSYTYRVTAVDALGKALGGSDPVTI